MRTCWGIYSYDIYILWLWYISIIIIYSYEIMMLLFSNEQINTLIYLDRKTCLIVMTGNCLIIKENNLSIIGKSQQTTDSLSKCCIKTRHWSLISHRWSHSSRRAILNDDTLYKMHERNISWKKKRPEIVKCLLNLNIWTNCRKRLAKS